VEIEFLKKLQNVACSWRMVQINERMSGNYKTNPTKSFMFMALGFVA